jgi:putative DNA primase/helicase
VEKRAASVFAIMGLAGELAIEYALLPWKDGSAFKAAHAAFQRWQTFIGPAQTEDRQILEAVSNFIAKHGDSRFSPQYPDHALYNDKTIQNRAGWYKVVNDERVYMFFSVALLEAGAGFERSRIVEALKRAKWLIDNDPGRMTKKTRTNAGVKNLYHISEGEASL